MAILRHVVGETLRGVRLRQNRTLREVSASARVSLGYLSEIERGHKEPSSELLAAICDALETPLSEVFLVVSDSLRKQERMAEHSVVLATPTRIAPAVPTRLKTPAPIRGGHDVSVRSIPTVAA